MYDSSYKKEYYLVSHQKPTVIIALGGNALSPKKEAGTIEQQFKHTRETLKAVMHFVKLNYNICITHGNGPQVGAELSKNEIAMDIIPPLTLNVRVSPPLTLNRCCFFHNADGLKPGDFLI